MKRILTLILFTTFLSANELNFETIQSDFTQIITNEQNSKIMYEGNFYATSNAKALWIYTKPINKKIYFDKNTVVIVEPELEQAIITNLKNTPNLTEILQSAKKVSSDRYEASYEETTYSITIKHGKIATIEYRDKLDNAIVISLSNLVKNAFLDDALFKEEIPLDYDILTQ